MGANPNLDLHVEMTIIDPKTGEVETRHEKVRWYSDASKNFIIRTIEWAAYHGRAVNLQTAKKEPHA